MSDSNKRKRGAPGTMIGLERGVVRLAPYTAEWKRIFEEEKARLETAVERP